MSKLFCLLSLEPMTIRGADAGCLVVVVVVPSQTGLAAALTHDKPPFFFFFFYTASCCLPLQPVTIKAPDVHLLLTVNQRGFAVNLYSDASFLSGGSGDDGDEDNARKALSRIVRCLYADV